MSEDNLIMWWSWDNDILSYLILILWSPEDHLMIMGKFWWLSDYQVLNICWSSLDYLMIIFYSSDFMLIIWLSFEDLSSDEHLMIILGSPTDHLLIMTWTFRDHLIFNWIWSHDYRMIIWWSSIDLFLIFLL